MNEPSYQPGDFSKDAPKVGDEEAVELPVSPDADEATLDLVVILSTFKAAIEDLNTRVTELEKNRAQRRAERKLIVPGA